MPSFKDTAERNDVCHLLLKIALPNHVGDLWDEKRGGPTRLAASYVSEHAVANHVPLSSGEMTALLVAMDFWNGSGHARIYDILNLPPPAIEAIGDLLKATAARNVSFWLDVWRERCPEPEASA